MMVIFVSECEKKALSRTRKVLDAYADRIGSNTWQTVITQDGLLAVKKSLRKTASKNTAVSCHWIRSRSRSELMWVVGQRNKFNKQGIVPVNSTQADLLMSSIENDWPYLPLIRALVALSALLHDWGKASLLFQNKLDPNQKHMHQGDPIRHEWISCLLFNAFIKLHINDGDSDIPWLSALTEGNIEESKLAEKMANPKPSKPLGGLPPIAQLVSWLIVSHHRLPVLEGEERGNLKAATADYMNDALKIVTQAWQYENKRDENEYQQRVEQCFIFPKGLLSESSSWIKNIKKWSQRLIAVEKLALQSLSDGSYRSVLHHARLCLMLGDHVYSSKDADKTWLPQIKLFANTDRKTSQLKQYLDEHLVGVAKQALRSVHQLPAFETQLPYAQDIPALKKRSPKAYRWQDKAVEAISVYRLEQKEVKGFFVVNMASTGCGKTFANAKVMRALSSDGNRLRFILALGLRTLTLQTGDEYRKRVGLDDSDLAVLIGSSAVMSLHRNSVSNNNDSDDKNHFESSGSLSEEPLLDEHIDYDCDIPEDELVTLLKTNRDRQFLHAPVLACTIDHIMAATETTRGGRYILPCLRLMSSDLVIDEVDDFTGNDLIAIGRLIYTAAMLGRKVMISSATIPPDLAEGYFNVYREGWRIYCKTRSSSTPQVACAWIDEFTTQVCTNDELQLKESIRLYREHHQQFIAGRINQLVKQVIKRKATISACESIFAQYPDNPTDEDVIANKQQAFFHIMFDSALQLHQAHHHIDPATQLKVSFGVIRVANISPCIELTRYLLSIKHDCKTAVRVMAYHSQQVLLLRHQQEQHLDAVLKRKEAEGEPPYAFSHSYIRQHLDTIHQDPAVENVLFIVVATPVEEVGRDHDFDWAVVEPSSYRSIIQLAGRVRRHRQCAVDQPNIALLQYNWKAIKGRHRKNNRAFIKPGFEDKHTLVTHDLTRLLDEHAIGQRLDAIPRISKPTPSRYTEQLADLEHHATKQLVAIYKTQQTAPGSLRGYWHGAWFLTALPQTFSPFRDKNQNTKVFLVHHPDQDGYRFSEKNQQGEAIDRESLLNIKRSILSDSEKQRLWLCRDFQDAIETMAEEQQQSSYQLSLRYGELSFRLDEGGCYEYNDQLGIHKVKSR